MTTQKNPVLYQLKVTLNHSKPPIWRRFEVSGDVTLARLHDILQTVMGWTDSHLHQFRISNICYGIPDPEWDDQITDEHKVRLCQMVPGENFQFSYDYDFGDGWEHNILVEKITPVDTQISHAICLTGKRACPPEDCGGIWGYEELLNTIKDPKHPEHQAMLEWLDGEIDPEQFDMKNINQQLKALR